MPPQTPRGAPKLPASLLRSRPGGLPKPGKWIATADAAARLHVHPRTVRHWIGRHLRALELEGRLVVAEVDVEHLERRLGLEARDRSAELVGGLLEGRDAAELVARSGASIEELERAHAWIANVRGRIVLEPSHVAQLAGALGSVPATPEELLELVEGLRRRVLELAAEIGAASLTPSPRSRS